MPTPTPRSATLPGRLVSLLSLTLAAIIPPVQAQPATGTATLTGRVQNEVTGQYLNNARVSVRGTDQTVFTDETGTFRLPGLRAGAATVEAFYSGLDPVTAAIDLKAGETARRDFNLTSRSNYGGAGNVVKLDAFVLSSSKLTEGESLATNEQRFAPNVKNVVATDAFGDVAEGNVAEFMKFLPGVTIEYSDASPNAVAVRGFDPNLTSVTMDGAQLANASGSAANRAFLFTQVSINNTSRIEVTKVPTPANPADGISGTVNMVSKSAFERSRAQFNYRVTMTASSDGLQLKAQPFPFDTREYRIKPGFDFDYTLPITKDFGIVFTGLSSKQWNEQNISAMTWNATAAGTGASPSRPFLQTHQIIDAPKWYTRDSTSLKADWRVTPNSVLSFGGQATYYRDKNGNINRSATTGTNATPSIAGGSPLSYSPDRTEGATGRGGVTFSGNFIHIAARTLAAHSRYRFDNGTWKIDAGAHLSTSKTWRRYHEHGSFNQLNISTLNPVRVTFEGITPDHPTRIRVFDNSNRELDINDISNYRLTTATSNAYRDHKENLWGGDTHLKRSFSVRGIPAAVQIGGLFRSQERDRREWNRQWNYTPATPGDLSPAPFLAQVYKNRPNYFGFNNIPWTSTNVAVEAWKKNPSLFVQSPAQVVAQEQSRIVGSEWLRERIKAMYTQAEARLFGNRLTILGGVRYEETTDFGEGPVFEPANVWQRTASGAFVRNAAGQRVRRPEAGAVGSMEELRLIRLERANRAERSYDGYYPSLHFTFNATSNFLVRAAYAKTYGRPDFTNIVPNATINEADLDENADPTAIRGNISVRNTGLKPWTAENYDLSAEYYTDSGGLLTAGVFRKDIADFFGTYQTFATAEDLENFGLDPRYVGWLLNTTVNSGDARVSGYELNVRQSLAPLGRLGRHFSVFANYTRLRLEGSRTADFNRFIPESMNWGVTITRNPITFMAKWHHRGEQNRGPSTGQGPRAFVYQDARTTLDLNLTYQATKRISVFVNCRNVENVHFNASRYQEDTPAYARRSSANSYGALGSFGIRGTF
jgi:iron complex outermembrane receptor protein